MKKLSVIIPNYNESYYSLNAVLAKLFIQSNIEVIVVDDGSDIPVELKYKVKVIRREKNRGYGSAIKLGMQEAKGNYIGIIDSDGQYDPIDLIELWEAIEDEDMLIGKRITHQGGWKRLLGRMFIKIVASLCYLRYVSDLNSGLRIFKKNLAKSYTSLLCDEFSFTTSLTTCFIIDGFKVKWLPIGFYPRQGNPSTVKMVRHGLISLFQIIYITIGLRTRNLRKWLREK